MRLISLASLSILARVAVADNSSPYSLDSVQADISAFVDSNNATLQTRDTSIGCAVAVSNPGFLRDGNFRGPQFSPMQH